MKPKRKRYVLGVGYFKTQPGLIGFGIMVMPENGGTITFKGIKPKRKYRLVMEEI